MKRETASLLLVGATLAKLEAIGRPMTDAWLKKVGAMSVDGKVVIPYCRSGLANEDANRK